MAHRLKEWAYQARTFVYQLLRVDFFRWIVAYTRYLWLVKLRRNLRTLEPGTADIGVNTVHHNLLGLWKTSGLAVPRAQLLAYPLAAIRLSKATPILVIGPRSEGELLLLKGLGFRNVRGLDLITYSPWVDLGDMHAMPYRADTFGVAILSWCLAYSDNRHKAAGDVVRIVKHGGLVAVGVEYSAEKVEDVQKRIGYEICDKDRMTSTDQILGYFGAAVDRVFFRHDLPDHPVDKWQLLVIFSVKK